LELTLTSGNDPWAGFPEATDEQSDNGPWNEFRSPADQQGALPVITDDGSGWSSQPAEGSRANPFDQFDPPPHGNRAKLTPVEGNPYAQFAQPDSLGKGEPTWSSSAFSVLPISQYADGTYDWDSNAGMVGAAKRLGQSVVGAIENLPDLARQVGRETAFNTAAPRTAGEVANLAALTTSGDMIAPGLSGTSKSMVRPTVPVPTSQELHAEANADYDIMRGLDVYYDPDHVASVAQGAQDALSNQGWSSETAPKTHAVLSRLANPDAATISVPLNGLAQARAILGRIGQGADRSDAGAAKSAKNALDGFIQNPPPEAVLAGPATLGSAYLQRANGDYAAAMRSDKLNAAGNYAQFRAASAHSGANFDNSLRQQVRPLIDPRYPQRLSGFQDPEIDAITRVVEGSPVRNSLRIAGNVLGGGGGMHGYISGITGAGAGYEAAGLPGAAVGLATPVVGAAAKYGQNKMARSALSKADELIRSRSPMYQERVANAPLQMPVNAKGMAAIRASAGNQTPPDQAPYAKGGKVKKPSHEFLVQRLMMLAERAKKAEKKATAPILNMPDDAVTAALRKAQEAI